MTAWFSLSVAAQSVSAVLRRVFPAADPRVARAEQHREALVSAESLREVMEPIDLRDVGDIASAFVPAASAGEVGDSPAGVSVEQPAPPAGRPNLEFPDPAEMHLWPDWLVMRHAANCLAWPKHDQLSAELRARAEVLAAGDLYDAARVSRRNTKYPK